MRAGRIMGELSGDAIAEEGIVRHAMGLETMAMNGDVHVRH